MDLYGEDIPVAAVNANLVALCSIIEGSKHFNVHGFGNFCGLI